MHILTVILVSILFSTSAHAKLYKCIDLNGNAAFQQQPCTAEQSTEWVEESKQEKIKKQESDQREKFKGMSKQEIKDLAGSEATPNYDFLWSKVETPNILKLAVKDYLSETLRDPSSLKDLKFIQTIEGLKQYKSIVTYRATNGYGGYIRAEKVIKFTLDGEITRFKDALIEPLWMQ